MISISEHAISFGKKSFRIFPEVHWITIQGCRSDSKFSIGQFFMTCVFFFISESGQSEERFYFFRHAISHRLTEKKYLLENTLSHIIISNCMRQWTDKYNRKFLNKYIEDNKDKIVFQIYKVNR